MKKFVSLLLVFIILTSVVFAQSGTVDWTKESSQGERLGGHISVGQMVELWRYDEKTWRHEDITLTQKQMNDLLAGKLEGKGLRTGSSTTRVDLPKEVKDYLKKGGKTEDIEVIFQSTNFDKLSLRQDQIYYQDPKYKITDEHIEVTIYPIFNVHREPIYGSRFDPNMKIDIPQPLGNYGYSAYSIFDKNGNNIGSTTSDYLTPDMIKDHKGYLHSGHTIKVGEMGNYNKTYKSEDIRIGWGDLNTGGAIGLGFRYPMLVAFYVKEGTNLIAEELTTTYDTPTETLKVKGKIRYLGKEDLDKTEVEFIWSTNDNQNGSKVIELKDLKPDKTFNVDIEVPIKNNPNKKVEGIISMEVNPKQDIEEVNYDDNKIKEEFELPIEGLDFWAESYEKQTKAEVDKDISVKINVGLTNSEDDLTTNLIIYNQSGREVTRKNNIKVVAGTGDIVEVIIDKGKISAGDNTFYAVINSDFNLSKGTPIETEEFLDNNKAEFVISLTDDDLIERSEGCSFSGDGETRTGIYYTCCSWGPDGCNSYGCCGKERLTLYHSSEITYTSAELSSDSWHTMKDGQEFGIKKNLPTGLDLSSNPAKNNLMSAIGINPLRQVIASGHGIRVRGTIRIKGSAEDFDSPSTARINRYVDDLIENSFVVGAGANFDESGGTAKLRNNEGVHFQKLELDTTRSSRRYSKSSSEPSGTAGSEDCTYIEKFRTEYDYEIPVIITQAKGKINEIGKNPSQWKNVPNERKFFTYLNELNGEYSMYLRADRNSSILGLVNGDIKSCNHKPNNFKMGIYGTMFEYPGVVISEPDKSIWDN